MSIQGSHSWKWQSKKPKTQRYSISYKTKKSRKTFAWKSDTAVDIDCCKIDFGISPVRRAAGSAGDFIKFQNKLKLWCEDSKGRSRRVK